MQFVYLVLGLFPIGILGNNRVKKYGYKCLVIKPRHH